MQDEQNFRIGPAEVQRPIGVQLAGVVSRGTELRIAIGGVTVAMRSREADLCLGLQGPHTHFAVKDPGADIVVDAAWDTSPPPPPGPLVFDSGGVWRLYRDGGQLTFHLTSPKLGPLPYARATFSPDFAAGTVYLRPDWVDRATPTYPLQYPLDELVITNWLARGRGVELHACGVVDNDGSGYLFTGYSGAGKTTMARIWRRAKGVRVLSDDRIVVTLVNGEVWMHGTPWHGDEPLASPERARLHRIFVLRHATENLRMPLTTAQSVMHLFARSFPPFFNASGVEFTLALLNEVATLAPVFELGFVPTPEVRRFIRASTRLETPVAELE